MNSILPLKLKQINYTLNNNLILNNLSLEIKKGKPKIILGSNGAGKTTLMRMCHGLIKPDSGQVQWQGNINQNKLRSQSMVFQRPIMLKRSVKKNLEYVLKIHNTPKNRILFLIDEILELVNLKNQLNFPAYSLSSGEQQKLAIARAWLLKPEVFFLDEPTASLDPNSTQSIEKIIKSIENSGSQIIMSTHNLGQAKRIDGEIIFLSKGKIIKQSSNEIFFKENKNEEIMSFLNNERI